MFSKILHIIGGIVVIGAGIRFYKEGWSHLYGHPVPRVSGILFIVLGLAIIVFAIFRKNESKSGNNGSVSVEDRDVSD